MIRFACPSCRKVYAAPDEYAGKETRCKRCGTRVMIPEPPDQMGSPGVSRTPDEADKAAGEPPRQQASLPPEEPQSPPGAPPQTANVEWTEGVEPPSPQPPSPQRRRKYEFAYFHARVASDPERSAEQIVRGRGGLTGVVLTHPGKLYNPNPFNLTYQLRTPDSHSVIPRGYLEIDTTFEYSCSFWVRTDEGRETLIVLKEKHPPVRNGHELTFVAACRGRRYVIVGFVNHTSGESHRILSAADALRQLGLSSVDEWAEAPVLSSASLARRRQGSYPPGVQAAIVLACGLVLLGGLLAVGQAAGGGTAGWPACTCLLPVGIVLAVGAAVAWGLSATGSAAVPRPVPYARDMAGEFDRDYRQFLREVRPRDPGTALGGR